MSSTSSESQQGVLAEAAAWVARVDAGLSPAEEAEYQNWMASDPRRRSAIDEMKRVWQSALRPHAEGQGGPLAQAVAAVRRRRRIRRAAAASVASLAVVAGLVLLIRQSAPADYTLLAPEQERLPDGSLVERPLQSEVVVDYSAGRRHVILRSGMARFTVAKDREHPFVVSVGGVDFRAVGTEFVVESGPQIRLVVTEGTVAVQSGGEALQAVTVGEGLEFARVESGQKAPAAPSPRPLSAAEIRGATDWAAMRVDFRNAPLSEVAEVLSRHGAARFVIQDAAIGSLRVTGTVRCDQTDDVCRALEAGFGIAARREGSRVELSRL